MLFCFVFFFTSSSLSFFFFFNDTATTEIYTLSLHDALPISLEPRGPSAYRHLQSVIGLVFPQLEGDRKRTRLNSSHRCISYAVFCLKKKKRKNVNSDTKKK